MRKASGAGATLFLGSSIGTLAIAIATEGDRAKWLYALAAACSVLAIVLAATWFLLVPHRAFGPTHVG
ncbi:MAG: hypothetical protein IMZ75_01375 [Actinobacteria bacterium]|nr:hypothetical protein [Actinomycetota bacterium]